MMKTAKAQWALMCTLLQLTSCTQQSPLEKPGQPLRRSVEHQLESPILESSEKLEEFLIRHLDRLSFEDLRLQAEKKVQVGLNDRQRHAIANANGTLFMKVARCQPNNPGRFGPWEVREYRLVTKVDVVEKLVHPLSKHFIAEQKVRAADFDEGYVIRVWNDADEERVDLWVTGDFRSAYAVDGDETRNCTVAEAADLRVLFDEIQWKTFNLVQTDGINDPSK